MARQAVHRQALEQEGFGVLSEIELAKTLRENGVDMALNVKPNLALLLPCNVVVAAAGDRAFTVSAVDASAMLTVVATPALDAVAGEVNRPFLSACSKRSRGRDGPDVREGRALREDAVRSR